MTQESAEIQAPDGTYQKLASLEESILGNAYTKRFVNVNDVPEEVTGRPWLSVRVRVYDSRPGSNRPYNSYTFGITEDDRVVNLRGSRVKIDTPVEITPPSVDELLKEISAAERIQPTLKR